MDKIKEKNLNITTETHDKKKSKTTQKIHSAPND